MLTPTLTLSYCQVNNRSELTIPLCSVHKVIFNPLFTSQTAVVPQVRTVYVQRGDMAAIHYTAGSEGVIYYGESASLSDLKETQPENVQGDNFDQVHQVHFAYNNDRRTTAIRISIDCITSKGI